MNRSTFGMKYMNGLFSKARYMNGEGFEILARTPVPKLPPLHPSPRSWEGGGGGGGLFKRLHITIQIVAGDTSFTRMIMSKQDYIYGMFS